MTTSKQGSIMVTYLAVLASLTLNPVPSTNAIDKTRLVLLKDALSWMTFKRNGILMNSQDRENFFLETILSKYTNSKFYRVFVIQFQFGVLPKLTLNEGASCDPSYTWKYKDPWNSSVTWHYQKQFVAESYRSRNNANLKYCDYRQGLICSQFTRKCECPEGSKMQGISSGSTEKRCLLEEDEICALIDIEHGNDPKHGPLVRDLPKLMFNLEKPPSCKVGTQCRFRNSGDWTFPRCYERNSIDWIPENTGPGIIFSWSTPLGHDCAIGLYANPGQCDLFQGRFSDPPPGLICYNFGPPFNSDPRSASNRTGYCAHELGSFANVRTYKLQNGKILLRPAFSFIGYVHPKTTPLRYDNLIDYYQKYYDKYSPDGAQTSHGRCSTQKTERMLELWKYFAGLEKTPPPGQEYVPEATNDQLYKNLNEVLSISRFVSNAKFCRPHEIYPDSDSKLKPPMKCVGDGKPVDASGNDGDCKDDPTNVVTKPAFDRFYNYLEQVEEIFRAEREEDKLTPELEQIWNENKDKAACDNEGNSCQEGFWCYDDLSDKQGIYDGTTCKIKDSLQLEPICHDLSEDTKKYGNCEEKVLDERVKRALEEIGSYPTKLGRGDECQVKFERDVRDVIGKNRPVRRINKYSMLGLLENAKNGKGKGLCDITRLLYCSPENGKCECFDDTEQREGGVESQSDYCYKTSGDCRASSFEHFYQALTMSEKEVLTGHYGTPDDDCKNTNLCLFVTPDDGGFCTSVNTGITGGGDSSAPPGNGWGDAGTASTTGIANYWNIVGLMVMIIVFT